MSGILGTAVTGAGGGAYTIDNSLRFRSSASAYLSRTPASTGNRTTWTYSVWVKRGKLGSQQMILDAANTNENNEFWVAFLSSDAIGVQQTVGGTVSGQIQVTTNAVFRDPSAWYHVVLAVDTTQGTSTNRLKLYVNNVAQTFSAYTVNSVNTWINYNSQHLIGQCASPNTAYFDGYMAEINFVNGQQLTPSSFGETNASTGVWQPKAYTGTYGTNGFYLKFSDIATTSGSNAGLGKDFSGNSNYWTTNNISVTSGVTYDAMLDSPTPKSATVGNFAVMNPLQTGGALISEGNLLVDSNGATHRLTLGTMQLPTSGKWYWEVTSSLISNSRVGAGICLGNIALTGFPFGTANTYGWYYGDASNNISWESNGTTDVFIISGASGNVLQFCYDADNGTLYAGKNNVFYSSTGATTGNPSTLTNPTSSSISVSSGFFPFISNYNTGGFRANFGQRPFAYTPPTNFKALQTYNLPTPTVGASSTTLANKYMDVSLYTGNGTGQSITNSGSFQPDLVWIKDRSAVAQHVLTDAVRGTSYQLFSSLTNAEQTNSTYVTAFNSNGFTVGVGTSGTGVVNNTTPDAFVAWQWKGANGTVSNTSGSITSTVSANTTSGFSVVTYTGTGVTATVGHGLGVAPSMIIIKNRSVAGNWPIYHASLGNTVGVYLNLTNGAGTTDGFWNNTSPTSTVFTVKDLAASNGSGNSIVAYCFAEKTGFSKFGSYTGNGSSDGTFVYTGFRPRYIMLKRTDSTSNWLVLDTARSPYNAAQNRLFPNLTNAEDTSENYDILSNGFKMRDATSLGNTGTIIFAAFAESPFNYSLAR